MAVDRCMLVMRWIWVQIQGKAKPRMSIFVATEQMRYAFDAEGRPATPLWRVNFTNRRRGVTTVAPQDVKCPFIQPGNRDYLHAGELMLQRNAVMFWLARRKGAKRAGFQYLQQLHALDVTSGTERFRKQPVKIRHP